MLLRLPTPGCVIVAFKKLYLYGLFVSHLSSQLFGGLASNRNLGQNL